MIEDDSASAMIRMAGALALERLLEMQLVRSFAVASPVAGAEWSAVVPPGVYWEVLSLRFRLTASATVATRVPTVTLLNQDLGVEQRYAPGSTQGASTQLDHEFAAGLGAYTSSGVAMAALPAPALVVPPSWTLKTSTNSIDVTDQYTLIFVTVREWAPSRIAQRLSYLLADLDAAGGLV